MSAAMLIIVLTRLFSFSYLYLLPKNNEIKEVQNKLEKMNDVNKEETGKLAAQDGLKYINQ